MRTAAEAGADVVALCDTNGGMLPDAARATSWPTSSPRPGARLGIHCHDDSGCAVANSLAAVDAGATHVQGAANGYGERSGNANLFTLVANLQLKHGRHVVPDESLAEMTRIAHADLRGDQRRARRHQPYVGLLRVRAQGRPARLRAQGRPDLYQHIDPALVGNDMRMLVSDMAGRANVELKGRELGYDLSGDRDALARIIDRVKELEACGYSFEAADASFELLLRNELDGEPARTSPSSPGASSSSADADGRRPSARPLSRCTPRASGSSRRARATARSTPSTRRCARPRAALPAARRASN